MKDLKKHASISEQIALMKRRGLVICDEHALEATLRNVNYYRLSGYLHDFKESTTGNYKENTTWARIIKIYDFDRKMTRILMYALEDIEETLKTRFSYLVTSTFPDDPLIYLKPIIYRDHAEYLKFLKVFYKAKDNNAKLPFVKHHILHYDGFLPMWVAVELFTMGNLHALYDNLLTAYQKKLAKLYGTGPRQLASWIENLTYTRNHLAHYMRIYNFNFGRTPMDCRAHPRKFTSSFKIFDQIFTISCMYSSKSDWNGYVIPEIKALMKEYSDYISLADIGFPSDWESILIRR